MKNHKQEKLFHPKRVLRIFLPFFLILMGVVITSLVKQFGNIDQRNVDQTGFQIVSMPTPTSVNSVNIIPSEPDRMVKTPAAGNLQQDQSIESSPEPVITLPPENIKLVGPPVNSSFFLSTPLTIYWDWQFELQKNQQFDIYLLNDLDEHIIGSTNEASLGTRGYQLSFVPDNLINAEGNYAIQIRLEQIDPSAIIAISKPRAVTFIREFRNG